jgi:hypothetical protein
LLSQFFRQQLHVSFLLVPSVGDSLHVNVDTKIIDESTDAVVVHGTHLVYVALLSESLCLEAHLLAERELGQGLALCCQSRSLKASNIPGRMTRSCLGHRIQQILW